MGRRNRARLPRSLRTSPTRRASRLPMYLRSWKVAGTHSEASWHCPPSYPAQRRSGSAAAGSPVPFGHGFGRKCGGADRLLLVFCLLSLFVLARKGRDICRRANRVPIRMTTRDTFGIRSLNGRVRNRRQRRRRLFAVSLFAAVGVFLLMSLVLLGIHIVILLL